MTGPTVARQDRAQERSGVASDVFLLMPGGLEGKEVGEIPRSQISEGEGRNGESGGERAQVAADVLVKRGKESRGGEGEVEEGSSRVGKGLAAPAGVGGQRIAYLGFEIEGEDVVLFAQ